MFGEKTTSWLKQRRHFRHIPSQNNWLKAIYHYRPLCDHQLLITLPASAMLNNIKQCVNKKIA
jgi:hypothetical protein